MRVKPGLFELLLKLVNHRYIQKMFNAMCRVMKMIVRQRKMPSHVRFPQPVRPHQMLCMFSPGIRQHPIPIGTGDEPLATETPTGQPSS